MVSPAMKLRATAAVTTSVTEHFDSGYSDGGSPGEEADRRSQEEDSDFELEAEGGEAEADDDDEEEDDSEDSGGGGRRGRRKRGRASSAGTSDDSYSDGSGRRRQRRRPQKKPKPPPPETAMRRKLRQRGSDGHATLPGSAQAEDAGAAELSEDRRAGPSAGVSAGNGAAEDPPQPAAVTRECTADEIAKELEEVQSMWEMASILEFLELFKAQLDLRLEFRAEDLERALVSTTGDMGLLMDVHRGLLGGIMPRTAMPAKEWHTFLAKQIYSNWERLGGSGNPPLRTGKGQDAAASYAKMPSKQRVLCLKMLCEVRMECADIEDRIEEGLRISQMSDKRREALINTRPKRGAAPVDVLEDFRREPLGVASTGQSYWWMDWRGTTGSRMYCHTPVTRARRKGFDVSEGKWELIGSTVEQLQKVCEQHAKSKKKADRQLVGSVDGVVVELTARADEEERLQRLRSRLRLDVGVILDDGMGGRSRRARREVNYTFDEFDEMIGEAVREGRRGRSRPEAVLRPEPEETPYDTTGLRRGRSGRQPALLDEDEAEEGMGQGEEAEHAAGGSELGFDDGGQEHKERQEDLATDAGRAAGSADATEVPDDKDAAPGSPSRPAMAGDSADEGAQERHEAKSPSRHGAGPQDEAEPQTQPNGDSGNEAQALKAQAAPEGAAPTPAEVALTAA